MDPQASPSVLIVEDECALAATLKDLLELEGVSAHHARNLNEAREALATREVELVLLDLKLPDGSGLDLLEELPAPPLGPGVLVLTGHASVDTAVAALRAGALDFLVKPFDIQAFLHHLHVARERLRSLSGELLRRRLRVLEEKSSPWVRPTSRSMREVHDRVERLAEVDVLPVLVTGETGTGKEYLCQLLHRLSPRREEPWVAVNCAALDRSLLQSELFGHEKGSFTGATTRRKGLFELADRGTLFLDEIGELPLEAQGAFLRVLETGTFRRLGGTSEITTRVRVVAATNVDLEEAAGRGRFRRDLLYRLDAARVRVPPLRDRPEDCRQLAEHFCGSMASMLRREVSLSAEAVAELQSYDWPGNVRELRNVVERSVVLKDHGFLRPEDLVLKPPSVEQALGADSSLVAPVEGGASLEEVERRHIESVLRTCGGNRSQAARILKIARSTLLRKMERWSDAG